MSQKMNPEIKAEWVADLRSGEYKQGRGHLRNADGTFCCLGVLCDGARRHGLGDWDDNGYFNSKDLSEGNEALLPKFVADWAGLDTDNPDLGLYNATGLNDTGSSFAKIADLIDEYL